MTTEKPYEEWTREEKLEAAVRKCIQILKSGGEDRVLTITKPNAKPTYITVDTYIQMLQEVLEDKD